MFEEIPDIRTTDVRYTLDGFLHPEITRIVDVGQPVTVTVFLPYSIDHQPPSFFELLERLLPSLPEACRCEFGLLPDFRRFAAGESLGWVTYAVGTYRIGYRATSGDLGFTLLVGVVGAGGTLLSQRLDGWGWHPLVVALALGVAVTVVWIPWARPALAILRKGR